MEQAILHPRNVARETFNGGTFHENHGWDVYDKKKSTKMDRVNPLERYMFTRQNNLYKSGALIMAREGRELTLCDRRLINFLIAHGYSDGTMFSSDNHKVDVRRTLAFTGIRTITALKESLSRLSTVEIEISFKDEKERIITLKAPYLMGYNIDEKNDIEYGYSEIVSEFLYCPSTYGVICMKTLHRLHSIHATRLYELMALNINKRNKTIVMTVDEVRYLLGLEGKYKRTDNLLNRVVKPAIDEVNNISQIVGRVKAVRNRKTGSVMEFHFSIRRKIKGAQEYDEKYYMDKYSQRAMKRRGDVRNMFNEPWISKKAADLVGKDALAFAGRNLRSPMELMKFLDSWRKISRPKNQSTLDRDVQFMMHVDISMHHMAHRNFIASRAVEKQSYHAFTKFIKDNAKMISLETMKLAERMREEYENEIKRKRNMMAEEVNKHNIQLT